MMTIMDKQAIIRLKREGHSNRTVAEMLQINRKTVAKYWNEYRDTISQIHENPQESSHLQKKLEEINASSQIEEEKKCLKN